MEWESEHFLRTSTTHLLCMPDLSVHLIVQWAHFDCGLCAIDASCNNISKQLTNKYTAGCTCEHYPYLQTVRSVCVVCPSPFTLHNSMQ